MGMPYVALLTPAEFLARMVTILSMVTFRLSVAWGLHASNVGGRMQLRTVLRVQ